MLHPDILRFMAAERASALVCTISQVHSARLTVGIPSMLPLWRGHGCWIDKP